MVIQHNIHYTGLTKMTMEIDLTMHLIYFQDSWFAQIYEKFRNERKNTTDPEVLQKKRKSSENSTKNVSKSLRRGGINWAPAFPEGEDEASMKLHQRSMREEWKKRSPDMEKIKSRMMITFPHRRQMINGKTPLLEIMDEYPALFSYDEVNALYNIYIVQL